MVQYNFKDICMVPNASDFIDIVLSKTQRKTPTVVHKRYKISNIRQFYMRKVKFCSSAIKERIIQLLSSFPRVDNIHPFYGDLINVLYDKDHYKLALGQLNVAKNIVETICKDYIKLMKYGDSLYRCKQLKKAALGRMCSTIKKQDVSLKYLEEVRQHLSRLPTIDPAARTLIITGYPNVGKSSFINRVSRANVDVQPYAFTTKSLFVGHFYHKYILWQIIDTPGILDHPLQFLEGCNTIEMQAITAIAHIQASILFFIDLSPDCEYSIEKQLHLFQFLQPIFSDKPIVLVASKCDLRKLGDLPAEDRALIQALQDRHGLPLIELSNLSEEGIMAVRNRAADTLLEARVQKKLESSKAGDLQSRLQITLPAPRDHKMRPAFIPDWVAEDRANPPPPAKTAKEVQDENGGAGVFSIDLREHWDLKDPQWKYDRYPHIYMGQNVDDWVDPDIDAKLEALEKEETALEDAAADGLRPVELDADDRELYEEIKRRQVIIMRNAHVNNTKNKPRVERSKKPSASLSEMKQRLGDVGIDAAKAVETLQKVKNKLRINKAQKAAAQDVIKKMEGVDAIGFNLKSSRALTRHKSVSYEEDMKHRKTKNRLIRRQNLNGRLMRAGPGDHRVLTEKPKHLYSGRRKLWKNGGR